MLEQFREVWVADFEFGAATTHRPEVVCLVAHELHSSRTIRLWQDQLGSAPPYDTGSDTLFVAFFASAELDCHRALGWPIPTRIIDLYCEFRDRFNGLPTVAGNSLLGALAQFGLDGVGAGVKKDMRDLAMRGGPWTSAERVALLDYCESDVVATKRLLLVMLSAIDIPRALLRGRYMAAVSAMQHAGVPTDTDMQGRICENWEAIQGDLIAAVDANYGVFEGRTFKADRFAHWLVEQDIPWPRLETGKLDLQDDTFRQMAKAYPAVSPLRELRSSLSDLRLMDLQVGRDGRNRTLLSPFRARSGRNQPSNTKFIFGPATWIRGLIKPPPDMGVAYIDWNQQEFGIAAKLSGDEAMLEAYRSGDPYLAFAKQAGAVPQDATKQTHKDVRELYKQCVLGTQYGMEAESLARRIGKPLIVARELLQSHRITYRQFWRWSDAVINHALLHGVLWTVFGWHIRIGPDTNPRMLRNFPMQANGAEMLRLACCLATEAGIEVCAPVHDAILICAPLDRLEQDVAATRAYMAEASRAVLDGFELRTDVEITRYPDRYMDQRGTLMWARVCELVNEKKMQKAA